MGHFALDPHSPKAFAWACPPLEVPATQCDCECHKPKLPLPSIVSDIEIPKHIAVAVHGHENATEDTVRIRAKMCYKLYSEGKPFGHLGVIVKWKEENADE